MRIDSVQSTQTKRVEPVSRELPKEQRTFSDNQNKNTDRNKQVKDAELQKAVELINETVQMVDKKFEFEVHKGTNRTMVKVVDKETEEIIREIPPEEVLNLVEKMNELVGLMMDKKV
ncbi:flagellar protein FlaG [Alkalicella caledoniensis]|uniref:Flagellar protein FlaG n=1 Tax=Alkalicella caledoniensis TaxID=2731377 RepID=A0A7G9W709_ALKCA|nr:flagellar protein FlaG [Alkalicella caledoniensis]QNO14471.1 flagellar protein FlaG [Alkalicella caledoniensis]